MFKNSLLKSIYIEDNGDLIIILGHIDKLNSVPKDYIKFEGISYEETWAVNAEIVNENKPSEPQVEDDSDNEQNKEGIKAIIKISLKAFDQVLVIDGKEFNPYSQSGLGYNE
ncbi:hypothetical protein [Clostridium butyricum]|uniref:hypothetical protein n=1 Tax=Clostridium butyricum TaxID=1492 RepID=UPI0032BF64D0